MRWISHPFKGHFFIYVFVGVLFLVGVIFGAMMVNALSLEQRQDLQSYIANFFTTIKQGDTLDNDTIYWKVAFFHLKWIVLIWVLGLSIIGLPGILVVNFFKGVLIGFTVGYFVGQYSWKGLLFSLVVVAPHNLIVIPILFMCSVSAIAFSLYMIKSRVLMKMTQNFRTLFIPYVTMTTCMAFLVLGVASFETWVTPVMIRWLTQIVFVT